MLGHLPNDDVAGSGDVRGNVECGCDRIRRPPINANNTDRSARRDRAQLRNHQRLKRVRLKKVIGKHVQNRFAAFENVNNRMMQIELVKQGLTSAVMFNSKARISSPSELLYKKHVIATRGTFRPITRVKEDMLEAALKHFVKTKNVDESECVTVCEMSTHHLIGEADLKIDEADFLSRVDMLAGLGYTVMVSNHKDDFSLVEYLVRYSALSRALVLGSHNLHKILDKNYYKHVVGGLLEALGLMLSHNTSLFVFPITTKDGQLSVENVKLSEENRLLLNYLLTSGLVEELENDSDSIYISPSKICEMIKAKNEISHLVPASVVELISARKLYSE